MNKDKNEQAGAVSSAPASCYVCDCEELICNTCGNSIEKYMDERGGIGRYETFWYNAIGGKKHTHKCLVCQQQT